MYNRCPVVTPFFKMSHPRAPSWAPCAYKRLPMSYLFYTWNCSRNWCIASAEVFWWQQKWPRPDGPFCSGALGVSASGPLRALLPCKNLVKWGHLGSIGLVSLWEKEEITGMHVSRGKAMWEQTKKAAICKPQSEASEDMNPASTWILHFQPAEQWEESYAI